MAHVEKADTFNHAHSHTYTHKMTASVARIVNGGTDENDTDKCSEEVNETSGRLISESLMTPVNRMFHGRSVFITGASGFIGRVLLEKLLRCYGGIRRVYILLRPKKNVPAKERLHRQLLNAPIFDKIRSMQNGGQELLDKIVVVEGDIGEQMFGLSDSDVNMLLTDTTLSVVFHSAATVKFDEPMHKSIKFNLTATDTVIKLCKRMPNLICLCHVSTAYVNSDMQDNQIIEEKLYPMRETPSQMIELARLLDERLMKRIQPALVGDRPNTYTYTKALGEHLIALEASQLPVAIVRPSIVVAAWKEPLPGWIDNVNGPTGMLIAIGKGLLRTMNAKRNCRADIVPVDIVVNTMIAAGYCAAKSAGKLDTQVSSSGLEMVNGQANKQLEEQKPHIFHCTSGDINPVTWGQMEDTLFPVLRHYPSTGQFRYPFGTFKSNKYHDKVTRIIVHYLPALIIDFICLILGKKRQLLPIYSRIHSALASLSHFSTTNYNFKSNNMKLIQGTLTHPEDRRQLYTDIGQLDWIQYWNIYMLGAR